MARLHLLPVEMVVNRLPGGSPPLPVGRFSALRRGPGGGIAGGRLSLCMYESMHLKQKRGKSDMMCLMKANVKRTTAAARSYVH